MENRELQFYHSKMKLFIGLMMLLIVIGIISLGLILGIREKESVVILITTPLLLLLMFFFIPTILKLFRGYPYLIITDSYIQLEPYTRSEATIYRKDMDALLVSQFQFSKLIRVQLRNEYEYIESLSLHNKIRLLPNTLFGMPIYTISLSVLPKIEQPRLLLAVKVIMEQQEDNNAPIVNLINEEEQTLSVVNTSNNVLDEY